MCHKICIFDFHLLEAILKVKSTSKSCVLLVEFLLLGIIVVLSLIKLFQKSLFICYLYFADQAIMFFSIFQVFLTSLSYFLNSFWKYSLLNKSIFSNEYLNFAISFVFTCSLLQCFFHLFFFVWMIFYFFSYPGFLFQF